jgi:hypothetical protein
MGRLPGEEFSRAPRRNTERMDETVRQQLSLLTILHAACTTALEVFYAADKLIDRQLVADLEKMVERTRLELDAFAKAL